MPGKKHEYTPDTCGNCIYFAARYCSADHGGAIRYCRCWKVKGKNGGYAIRKAGEHACEHYTPIYAAWPTISDY